MRSFVTRMPSLMLAAGVAMPGLAMVQEAPGVTAEAIRIGSFGALTGPGYLYGGRRGYGW